MVDACPMCASSSREAVIIMAALVLLAALMVLGLVVLAGWTPDTRDPRYGLWPLSVQPGSSARDANGAASEPPRWP
jgi:hypothetical protein